MKDLFFFGVPGLGGPRGVPVELDQVIQAVQEAQDVLVLGVQDSKDVIGG